ncbi:MAG: hypothetical protein WBS22_07795 [Methylocystis sp.]
MTLFISRSRRVLLGCVTGAGLVIAASPASAFLYVLDFSTPSQTGQVYINAPNWATPGALPGLITGIWTPGSFETTYGAGFNENGVKQQIKEIIPVGTFSNATHHLNDNELLTFSNELHTNPPSSNFDPLHPWFSSGGFAVEAWNGTDVADATILDFFVKPPVRAGGLPTFVVESMDRYGHVISTPGTAILSVPGPALAAGYLGLSGLVAGGAALRLRKRLAAR